MKYIVVVCATSGGFIVVITMGVLLWWWCTRGDPVGHGSQGSQKEDGGPGRMELKEFIEPRDEVFYTDIPYQEVDVVYTEIPEQF